MVQARAHLRPRTLCALAAAFACAGGGCAGPAEATVEICGDLEVPGQLDAIRLTVRDDRALVVSDGVIELLQCPEGEILARLPVSRSFTGAGVFSIEAQGLKRGVVVIDARDTLDTGATRKGLLLLAQACLGVECPDGQGCGALGDCVALPIRAGADSCAAAHPADGGSAGDGGAASDAGTGDAGDAGWCDPPGQGGP